MEHMHDSIKERLGLSEPVEVLSFEDNYKTIIKNTIQDLISRGSWVETSKNICRIMDIPLETFRSLENDCGIHQLKCEGDANIDLVDMFNLTEEEIDIPEDTELVTLKWQHKLGGGLGKEHGIIEQLTILCSSTSSAVRLYLLQKAELMKRKNCIKYRRICRQSWLSGVAKVSLEDKGKTDKSIIDQAEVYSDSLLTVQVYRETRGVRTNRLFPEIDQELLVLGRQYLTELRDAITCTSDLAVHGEFSDNPENSQETRALYSKPSMSDLIISDFLAVPHKDFVFQIFLVKLDKIFWTYFFVGKDLYPSGFFFINNTFLNDMRRSDSRDYSEVIRQWAKDKGFPAFTTQLMEATRFCDLTIELGYPYLYMHQGSCEHLLVFSDLRLIGPYDSLSINHYPKIERAFPKRRQPCMICKIFTSKWITFDNSRASDDPFFYCDVCFRSFNYTKDGKMIGEFKALPYIDPNAIT